ncbi:MAG: ADOP family duplicated permease [Gemmatimonadaceae bacterium]
MLGPGWVRNHRFWRRAAARDVDDELAFHLAMREELFEAAGLDQQAARAAALRRFGDVDDVRARCLTFATVRERRMRRLELRSAVRLHVGHTFRRLRGAPGFAAAVVLMLALGIGAATTVFGVVDGVLLRPLPLAEPERLVGLSHILGADGDSPVEQSDATYLLYQREVRAFSGVALWRSRDVNVAPAVGAGAGDAEAERVVAATVDASFFSVLGATPLAGRTFARGEDRPGAPAVVVLAEGLWRRKFGGDPRIVGRQIAVDGRLREVVGIMPERFRYPEAATGLWYPVTLDPARPMALNFAYSAAARLRPGVTPAAAADEMTRVLARLAEAFPGRVRPDAVARARLRPVVTPLRDVVVGDVSRMLWLLLGAVALLLVVACANVAGLFVVRAEAGARDVAVRRALGAPAGAVAAQYLGEGLVLAAAGGAAGTLLAAAAVRALRTLPTGIELPRLAEVAVDGRVLLFALAVAAGGALVVSLLPALRARRIAPGVVLKESSRSATAGRDRQRARSALVVAQVALALVLVAGSALMARSFGRLRDVRPGFDPRGVLTMRVALPRAAYRDAARVTQFHERLLGEALALPSVRGAAVADWLPLADEGNNVGMDIEDRPLAPDAMPATHAMPMVSADWFRVTGIPLLAGRTFGPADAARPSTEVVVSRAFAERYWSGESPLGKRVRPSGWAEWFTVVGVVGDVHLTALEKPPAEAIYFPLVFRDPGGVRSPGTVVIALRVEGDPARLAPPLRAVVRRLDPALPTYDERPMAVVLGAAMARTRFVLLTLAAASVIALAIGAVGLYGVLAYGVALRRREIGVRLALGASTAEVTRMVARRGVALAAVGAAIGLTATLAATRLLGGLLYSVSPTDPVALVATCGVLLGVALVASWLPARRAAAVDPAEALRRD